MVKFKINGKEVQGNKEDTIWKIAKSNGISIPHLCHSDEVGYKPDGNCRACVVQVKGERTLTASCIRKPVEGMEVTTNCDTAKESKKKITVSTSGISKIIRLLADQNVKFNLAVSLHSAIEKTRNDIMPFSKDFPIVELLDSLNYWYKKTKSKITIEYLVWQAINDNMQHINSLVEFCVKVPSKVNLIEFNEIGNLKFKSPQNMWIQKYVEILKANNISVSIRRSRGKDINAACGQLANKI